MLNPFSPLGNPTLLYTTLKATKTPCGVYSTPSSFLESRPSSLAKNPASEKTPALQPQKTYWFVEQDENRYTARLLSQHFFPKNIRQDVDAETFQQSFTPEENIYQTIVKPRQEKLRTYLHDGETHSAEKEYFTAAFAYQQALELDNDNIPALLGLALCFIHRAETDGINRVLRRLLRNIALWDEEYRPFVENFATALREQKYFPQAVALYRHALQRHPQEIAFHLGLARVHLEQGLTEPCLRHIFICLDLESQHDGALQFLLWLREHNLIPARFSERAATQLQHLASDTVTL